MYQIIFLECCPTVNRICCQSNMITILIKCILEENVNKSPALLSFAGEHFENFVEPVPKMILQMSNMPSSKYTNWWPLFWNIKKFCVIFVSYNIILVGSKRRQSQKCNISIGFSIAQIKYNIIQLWLCAYFTFCIS